MVFLFIARHKFWPPRVAIPRHLTYIHDLNFCPIKIYAWVTLSSTFISVLIEVFSFFLSEEIKAA